MTWPNYRFWVIERIRAKSVPRESGCVEYGGDTPLKHKYGLISVQTPAGRKNVPAHRALWMALNDRLDLPRTILIRHRCDNPRCVNEAHLAPGSPKDNAQDMLERGRGAKRHRLHTRNRVHSAATILGIKAAEGKLRWIAEEFGVSLGYVSKIRTGKAKTLVVSSVLY